MKRNKGPLWTDQSGHRRGNEERGQGLSELLMCQYRAEWSVWHGYITVPSHPVSPNANVWAAVSSRPPERSGSAQVQHCSPQTQSVKRMIHLHLHLLLFTQITHCVCHWGVGGCSQIAFSGRRSSRERWQREKKETLDDRIEKNEKPEEKEEKRKRRRHVQRRKIWEKCNWWWSKTAFDGK